jgi:hypothetical protein
MEETRKAYKANSSRINEILMRYYEDEYYSDRPLMKAIEHANELLKEQIIRNKGNISDPTIMASIALVERLNETYTYRSTTLHDTIETFKPTDYLKARRLVTYKSFIEACKQDRALEAQPTGVVQAILANFNNTIRSTIPQPYYMVMRKTLPISFPTGDNQPEVTSQTPIDLLEEIQALKKERTELLNKKRDYESNEATIAKLENDVLFLKETQMELLAKREAELLNIFPKLKELAKTNDPIPTLSVNANLNHPSPILKRDTSLILTELVPKPSTLLALNTILDTKLSDTYEIPRLKTSIDLPTPLDKTAKHYDTYEVLRLKNNPNKPTDFTELIALRKLISQIASTIPIDETNYIPKPNIDEMLNLFDPTVDPDIVKTIFQWYKASNFDLNVKITSCTQEYKLFLADLSKYCFEKQIRIGDELVNQHLLTVAFYSKYPDVFNITKAYIHLGYYNETLNSNIPITDKVMTSLFNKASNDMKKSMEYLESISNSNY